MTRPSASTNASSIAWLFFSLFFLSGLATLGAVAQQPKPHTETRDYLVAGKPLPKAPVNKDIAAALRQVSADKIKANIETLVTFKNRSTVSSIETDLPPGTGVLAASDWIKAQFES